MKIVKRRSSIGKQPPQLGFEDFASRLHGNDFAVVSHENTARHFTDRKAVLSIPA